MMPDPMPVESIRAPVQWYGGKGNLRSKLAPLIPYLHGYCEPFGGAASMLFARQPSPCEVFNDIDGDLVNLFRCLQDPATYPELAHRLQHTLYSRAEFCLALELLAAEDTSPLLRAWAFFVAHNQGFGGIAETAGNWGRAFVANNGMAQTTNRWLMRLALLPDWHRRLARVQIDQRDAVEVIRYWDREDFVFYCDPPYVGATRAADHRIVYAQELTDVDHVALLKCLLEVAGAVVLSAYPSLLYAPLIEAGWEKLQISTICYAAGRGRPSGLQGAGSALAKVPRTEVIWLNPAAQQSLRQGFGADIQCRFLL